MIGRAAECAQLHVRLFAGPSVHGVQGPVKLSPQQLALVAVVYGHAPNGISRPRVAQLIWGTEASSEARHRLRQLLVEIRSRVGSRIIDTHGDLLKPRCDVASDLGTFDQGLANGSLLDSALIVKSRFAPLSMRSVAEDYDDWRDATEAAQLRRLRVQSLARWDRANSEGDWLTAKDAAEALYALDPRDPDAVLRMIDILAKLGQPESAEKAFVEYRAGLPQGVDPSTDLIDAIQRARRLKEASRSVLGPAQSEVPLIGRRDALARARAAFDEVDAGCFAFVLISGESGIGKTRMLRELHREGVLRDFRCLESQAVELECRIPLNPLLDALKSVDLGPHLRALGRPWDAVVGTMLPIGTLDHPTDAPPAIQDSALPRRLLDAFALLFESLATEKPTLLFIDDLQWADATTVAALQFTQRRWNRGSLGVIATIRPDLVNPEDAVAKYLSSRLDGLGITRVDLVELSIDDALLLVEHIGNGEIGQELAQRICALAGLHPLYLTELARDYLAGRLRLPESPVDEVTIPVSLKQILDSRLTYLGDGALKVAGMLAVAARPMRLGDAGRLVGLSLDSAADAVDELRRARLIEYERDRVRIAHELFRSAIYRHLSEPRRAINHRAVAEHIEEADATADSSGELATHYARAGEAEAAAKHGWVAAERAMESGAVAEAAHFFQLVTENDRDPVRRAEATAAEARALHLSRDINRANPLLELAADRLRAVGKPAEALRLEIKRVEGLAEIGAASLGDLLERLVRIKAHAREREDWEGVALALDAELHLLHRRGDVGTIRSVFCEMREVAGRESLEATLLCYAGLALGVLFGDPDEALEAARSAVALTAEGRSYRLRALLRLMVVLQYRGMLELPESRPVIREARELAERSGDVLMHFSIESNLAVAALDAGDLEAAEAQMTRSSALTGSADMDLNRFIQANNKAELALAQCDFQGAERAYAEAASYAGVTTPAYMMDLVHAGIGLCALETGNMSEARRREEEIGSLSASWHFDPTTILAFRSRLLERRQDPQGAIDLLHAAADNLEHRLVLAWLKVRALEVRLLRKAKSMRAQELATEALNVATKLQLRHRVDEFSALLFEAGPTRERC
jgi:DNA-binding SARP family transcriptional activator